MIFDGNVGLPDYTCICDDVQNVRLMFIEHRYFKF